MNWYRRSQEKSGSGSHPGHQKYYEDTGGNEYDIFDAIDSHRSDIMGGYYSDDREPNSQMRWTVAPFGRLKKIWEDFMRRGVIHDEAGLFKIRDQFLDNLARLQAATDLSGHSTWGMDELAERTGYPAVDGQDLDFYFDYLETPYGTPISDYALEPLWNLAHELPALKGDPKSTLIILDRMLNVIHCRGDIASLFVEGGSESLDKLFGRPCGMKRHNEEA